jgi:chloramphenicol-sensitive protein RarD
MAKKVGLLHDDSVDFVLPLLNSRPVLPASRSILESGALSAVLAYTTWGLLPLYWKLFGTTPAVEVLSHRIVWSAVFLVSLLLIQRRTQEFAAVLRSSQKLVLLLMTATILACNLGLYIYGVNSDRVIETLGLLYQPAGQCPIRSAVSQRAT